MSTTQTVTLTPPTPMTPVECLTYIKSRLTTVVRDHLAEAESRGSRTSSVSEDNGTTTVTTTWTNDDDMETYKTLMSSVTPTVKSQLTADGWTFSFSPETADL